MRRAPLTVLIAAAALGFGGCGAAALQTSKPPRAISPARTVIFDCAGTAQSRPRELVLSCADAGDELAGLRWHGWGGEATFANGYEVVLTCVPNCAAGSSKRFPVVVDVSGLMLSGSDAAYRQLRVTITQNRLPIRGISRTTRYTLARTGPALDTNP